MKIKVVKAIGSPDKTASEIDLGLSPDIPEDVQSEIKKEVGQYLVEQVLLNVSKAKTPVEGEGWPALSPKYKERKVQLGGVPKANMELNGDLLDSLSTQETDKGIEIGFFDDQAWKADGHLKFSGEKNKTPKRRFLPGKGQHFYSDIENEVSKIIADKIAENSRLLKSELRSIETKKDLYDYLMEKFGVQSRSEVRDIVTRSPEIFDKLSEEDLIDLL